MPVLKWGVLGASDIAHAFVSAISTYVGGNHVFQAVAARDKGKAEQFANSHGIKEFFGSYEELLANEEIDIVYVSLVTSAHKDWTIKSLNAGKHVLCEKPLGINVEECQEMAKAAAETGKFLMEGHWSRFMPMYSEIKRLVKEKVIGDLKYIQGIFTVPIDKPSFFDAKLGGGALYGLGYYCPAFTNYLFDSEQPSDISAHGHITKQGADDSCVFTLTYPGGKIAQFLCSSRVDSGINATIIGTKGGIFIPDFWAPTEIFPYPDTIGKFSAPLPEMKYETFFKNSQAFFYQAEHVRECLEQGLNESPIMPLSDSILIAETLFEIKTHIGLKHPQDWEIASILDY